MYRGQREGKVRRWFVENNYIDRVVNVTGNTFEDTSIATCIVVLKKNRETTDIIFEDGEQIETVPLSEIEENDFNLSVNIYLPEEVKKEYIDPIVLENEARRHFLEILKKELDFDKMVCEMEGLDIEPFLNAIRAVVGKYGKKTIKAKDLEQMNIFDYIKS